MDIESIMTAGERIALPILKDYYEAGSPLYELLVTHSRHVAVKALECINRHGLSIDPVEAAVASLLHDIGIIRCKAHKIHCMGEEPYIRHGVIGREMLEGRGMYREALVCERHTGSGITVEDIEFANMPLPLRDMVPESELERLVCYADKFYSKSGDPCSAKSVGQIRASLSRFGSGSIERFDALQAAFG